VSSVTCVSLLHLRSVVQNSAISTLIASCSVVIVSAAPHPWHDLLLLVSVPTSSSASSGLPLCHDCEMPRNIAKQNCSDVAAEGLYQGLFTGAGFGIFLALYQRRINPEPNTTRQVPLHTEDTQRHPPVLSLTSVW
jgi:hypothetical protein